MRPRVWCGRCADVTEHYVCEENDKGRRLRCRPCCLEKAHQWYAANTERAIAAARRYRALQRMTA
jgi:hypothetical protein